MDLFLVIELDLTIFQNEEFWLEANQQIALLLDGFQGYWKIFLKNNNLFWHFFIYI
jgi:hypothetical protein